MARSRKRRGSYCPPNTDRHGKPLSVGDRVHVLLREGGVRIQANEGYPPTGVIKKWSGCGVAEVQAPVRAKDAQGYTVNYAPRGRYDISTSNLTKIGRARRK